MDNQLQKQRRKRATECTVAYSVHLRSEAALKARR
jgi:hypothetical protein